MKRQGARRAAVLAQHRRAILGIAPQISPARSPPARGAYGTAIASLERAVRLEDGLVYTEPSEFMFPTRLALGAILLAGRPARRGRDGLLGGPAAQPRVGLGALRPAPGARGAEEDRPGGARQGAPRQGLGARRREADGVALRPARRGQARGREAGERHSELIRQDRTRRRPPGSSVLRFGYPWAVRGAPLVADPGRIHVRSPFTAVPRGGTRDARRPVRARRGSADLGATRASNTPERVHGRRRRLPW